MSKKGFLYHLGLYALIGFMFYMVRPIQIEEPQKVAVDINIINETSDTEVAVQDNALILARNSPILRYRIKGRNISTELQNAIFTACKRQSIPVEIICGLIEVESNWRDDAKSAVGCYGLCQLNPKYFPSGLTPTEQIDTAVDYLAELYVKYDGDLGAALTAYNAGHDTGNRGYANRVFEASEHYTIIKEEVAE